MEEQAFITALQKLLESGALEKFDKPGGQTLLIYSLLITLAILLFRIFIMNGCIKKFFDLEDRKVQLLIDLNAKMLDMQTSIDKEQEKMSDMLHLLHARRQSDTWQQEGR
jgi:hypothetical protein